MSNGATDNKPREKDSWDKADVIGKFISGALLAVIALLIKFGADNIAASLEAGNLVRGLLADLTSQDKTVRQDLALIALDHAVGSQKPQLIVDISERIYRDLIESNRAITDEKVAFGSIAFQILEKRDIARAQKLRHDLEVAQSAEFRQLKPAKVAAAHTVDAKGGKGGRSSSEVDGRSQLLANTFPNLVYIHFRDNNNEPDKRRPDAVELRKHLSAQGFYAPGVEFVNTAYKNEVRFFYEQDKNLADELLRLLEVYRKEIHLSEPFQLKDLSGKGYRASRGLLEVWIDYTGVQQKGKQE